MPGRRSYSRAPWNTYVGYTSPARWSTTELRAAGVAFADQDRDLIRLSYDTVDSPYPFLLMIPQSQTQHRLDQRFSELGGSVLRGVRLLDLAPEFPGSAATVVDSNGELRVINARFVAGCDGLHSRVRDQLGIGFPGTSPAQMFAVLT